VVASREDLAIVERLRAGDELAFMMLVEQPLFGRSRSRKAMTSLWEISERETGITFDVRPP
jgi:hypothetical protein